MPESTSAGAQKRKWGRVRIEKLSCNLGLVLDLSAGGVRIALNRKLPDSVEIMLADPQNRLTVKATVAWQKRAGWKSYEAGLCFGEISAEQRRCLVELMHSAAQSLRVAA